jgi:hypothetical protein
MPYWEKPKEEKVEITVSDEELLQYEIDDINRRIKDHEDTIQSFTTYRNELMEKGIDAVKNKDFTMIWIKFQRQNRKMWDKYHMGESL